MQHVYVVNAGAIGSGSSSSSTLEPLGYEQIVSLSTVQMLDVPSTANLAVIQAEAQNIRWRDDGDDPTSSVGMILFANDSLSYNGNLSEIRLIEVSSGAIANISYYNRS